MTSFSMMDFEKTGIPKASIEELKTADRAIIYGIAVVLLKHSGWKTFIDRHSKIGIVDIADLPAWLEHKHNGHDKPIALVQASGLSLAFLKTHPNIPWISNDDHYDFVKKFDDLNIKPAKIPEPTP
jgi:hypothetical protein